MNEARSSRQECVNVRARKKRENVGARFSVEMRSVVTVRVVLTICRACELQLRGGWMDPRACLDVVLCRTPNISCPFLTRSLH